MGAPGLSESGPGLVGPVRSRAQSARAVACARLVDPSPDGGQSGLSGAGAQAWDADKAVPQAGLCREE